MSETKLSLKNPISAHGETLSEITLREPTGADIADVGLPFDLNGKVDARAVLGYVARLGNIPPSSTRTLSAPDVMAAVAVVASFFGDSPPQTSSESASTLPHSSGT